MPKVRLKSAVYEAFKLPEDVNEEPSEDLIDWLHRDGNRSQWSNGNDGTMSIKTLDGYLVANPGDWIIKGVQGELSPCKPDVFAETYEAVDGEII